MSNQSVAVSNLNDTLLAPDEPAPYEVFEGDGQSPFVFICDHAGCRLPCALGDLGVSQADRTSHIAWDLGIRGVAAQLAASLGAVLVVQNYSRLVIDCNRPLDAPDSIVTCSAGVDVPGNRGLTAAAREQRIAEVFRPYHAQVQAELDRRDKARRPSILVAMHSFTPVFMGVARPWHIGILYNRDRRLAHGILHLLRSDTTLVVGENQPYAVSDTSDYSIVTYGERRNIPHVEVEVRQDLIADAASQRTWAERIRHLLVRAVGSIGAYD
jgi:predicted N-formylglutamate amidohydrolase